MQIVLHIGTDKTGSTAIQQHLTLNRDWFRHESVYIPELGFGQGNGHSALLRNLDSENLEMLRGEVDAASGAGFKVFLLSWEGMNFYSAAEIRKLSAALTGHDTVIVVYLREQADLIQSGFLQQLKSNSNSIPLRVFESPEFGFEALRSYRLRNPPTRNYHKLLKRWQKGFAGASCAVRIFSSRRLINGDIVDDFLAQLGLSSDEQFQTKKDQANISLDVEGGILIDRWQRAGLPDPELMRLIDVTMSHIAHNGPGRKYFLSERMVRSIQRRFRRSNQRVGREFFGDTSALFPDAGPCWRDTLLVNVEQDADVLAGHIAQIDSIPTLNNQRAGKKALKGVEFRDGWHALKKWGIWSHGEQSSIRFRVWRRRMGPACSGLRLTLRGRYAGVNASTGVFVNGRNFGDLCLVGDHGTVDLPLALLLPYETVEINLRHASPMTPAIVDSNNDRRLIAFGLEGIGYQYLHGVSAPS